MSIRIDFPNGAAELEVHVPLFSEAIPKLFPALAGIGISSSSSYMVRTDSRLIMHARLSERNGKSISSQRAFEALQVAKSVLDA
jgi:hypothetical protein